MAFRDDLHAFFFRYRKLLTVMGIISLLYVGDEIYQTINELSSGYTASAVGSMIDVLIGGFAATYILVQVHRSVKQQQENVAEIDVEGKN